MNCSIISVGTELLFGQTVNTNSVFLSEKLNDLGFNVYYHFTVGDNPNRLEEILEYALSKADIIITTGGLGPTQDDLTKETISKAMGRELKLHEPTYEKLCKFFDKLCKTMSENNKKQAYLPENSEILENDYGTAPGFMIKNDEKIVISLPGPPREMKKMFENKVIKLLKAMNEEVIYSNVVRFFGIGESDVETQLIDLISNQTNPTIATYADMGEVKARITAKSKDVESANQLIKPVIDKVKDRLEDYIYSYENEELVEVTAKELIKNNLKLSLAESCTGGLIAKTLTDISGISKCLDRSLVTYSNDAKIQELGVDIETLKKYGAVSEETAKEMVIGLKEKTKSDICLAVTGIAGPNGGTKEKPVGLVYISVAYSDQVICKKHDIYGDRNRIRYVTTLLALNMIRNSIKK